MVVMRFAFNVLSELVRQRDDIPGNVCIYIYINT